MKLTPAAFLALPKKAITITGMSGLGKTHLSCMLAQQGWTHYSCDEVIGRDYLAAELDAPVSKEDLSPLSRFVGKLGDDMRGGLPLHEFKRRQKLYYDAESAALGRVGEAIARSPGHFINDSTGSLCEIEDMDLIDRLGRQTIFVYVKATPEEEQTIIQRAIDYPKPMFFPPADFDGWVADYLRENTLSDTSSINPDAFARWVFPILFAARLPKYQRLADLYGVTVSSEDIRGVMESADGFIVLIAEALQ